VTLKKRETASLVNYRYVTQNRVSEQAGGEHGTWQGYVVTGSPRNGKTWPGPAAKARRHDQRAAPGGISGAAQDGRRIRYRNEKKHDELVLECEQLREELAQARRAVAKRRRHEVGEGVLRAASAVLVQPVPDTTELDEKRLVVTLGVREYFSLDRLAVHHGLTKRAVIERLLWWADDSVVRSLGDDEAAFNRYLNRVTKNTK
jgi:hypothetical protein